MAEPWKPYRQFSAINPQANQIDYRDLIKSTGTTEDAADQLAISSISIVNSIYDNPVPLTTKGDLATFDTALVRLAVGSNDQVLMADSAETKGIKWASLTTTKGDLLGHDGSDPIRHAVGTNGQSLISDSSATNGIRWVWGCGIPLYEFGTGSEGTLTVGAGTTTLDNASNARHYSSITIASGGTLNNVNGSRHYGVWLYVSGTLTMTDSTSIITVQDTSYGPASGNGGTGSAGGGSGGDAGIMLPNIYIYARFIAGTGIIRSNATAGDPGSNATAAAGVGNGSAGTRELSTASRFWNSASPSDADSGVGGGGQSAGTGGTAGASATAFGDLTVGNVRDVQNYLTFFGTINFSNTATHSWSRAFKIHSSSGGGAGGRNNGGAQGAGGGGSGGGSSPWPVAATVVTQAGVAGGAGGAGGSGAGGGAGGVGGTGGYVYICCMTIAAGITVEAKGGNGGNGGNGHGWGGGGAGGNGGEGGWVIIRTQFGYSCTISVSGGTGGTGGAPGASGGSAGGNGNNGRVGTIWNLIAASA